MATVAQPAPKLAAAAGFSIPDDRTFIVVEQDEIGPEHRFSGEKLTTLMAVFRYHGFDDALDKVRRIYEVAGKGHSCGIYSFDDEHIDALARVAPVSRIMVRQPQSKANAGSFTNGMPMTSSLGCGVWGGNVTNENISLKHYLNVTWVSHPIPEDRPSERGAVRRLLRHRGALTLGTTTMTVKFSLAHLTVLGTTPIELIEIAAGAGYDYASIRTTRGGSRRADHTAGRRPGDDPPSLEAAGRHGRAGPRRRARPTRPRRRARAPSRASSRPRPRSAPGTSSPSSPIPIALGRPTGSAGCAIWPSTSG